MEDKGIDFEEIRYLDTPLSFKQLEALLGHLNMEPQQLVRTNEAIWKENYKGKNLSRTEIIEAMVKHPKLIERPIVSNGNKAVVARPAERITEIL